MTKENTSDVSGKTKGQNAVSRVYKCASVSMCYREERNEEEQTSISGYF